MSGFTHITPAKATATVTIVDYTNLTGQDVTVNGTTFTEGVAADWVAAGDNDTTALSLSGAIGTSVDNITVAVTANVITLTYNLIGTVGNSATLSISPQIAGTIEISGTTFTGGSSGIIGVSGSPVSVNLVSARSHATGVCTLKLYDGVDNTGTLVMSLTCPQGKASNFKITEGLVFKSGCFVDIILASFLKLPSSVTIGYEQI